MIDIKKELNNIAKMVENKMMKDKKGFPPFGISYTSQGNFMAQASLWETPEEKERELTAIVDFIKGQHPQGFIFGSLTSQKKFKTKEDYDNDMNYEAVPSILLIGRTPERSYNLSINYQEKDGQYVFEEHLIETTNENGVNFLTRIFDGIN